MIRILKKIFTSFVILSFVNSVAFAQSISNNALPTNPNVTSGSANISQTANKLTVNQNTDKLITNWSSFNIGKDATVQFVQPSSTASALNRVTSSDPSYIFGTLQANGKIILINPNGVLFANGAKVDVGSIIASTLNMVDKDYSSDQLIFEKGNLAGTIQNDGTIRAFAGGTVALIGSQVTNNGKIKTKQGTTALLAGDKVTLTLNGNRLIKYTIDQGALNSLVENNNAIIAKEGVVILSAKGLNLLSKSVVNNTGTIEAKGFSQAGGKIYLDGDQTTNSGKLVASSKNNSGGLIQVTGDEIKLTSTASLNASGATGGGTILAGGSYQNSDPTVRQSRKIIIEGGSVLNASATKDGDGGTIVAWSDINNPDSITSAQGTFLAKGGLNSGNGGRIETSGYYLSTDLINVNASGVGTSGTWLLDPYNITIGSSSSGTTYAANFTPTSTSAIKASDIVASLNSGTSVTITTGSAGSESGDITISNSTPILKTAGGDATLTLEAARNITVGTSSAITSTSGALGITLKSATASGATTGGVRIGSNLTSNGGDILIGGGQGTAVNGIGYAQNYAGGSSNQTSSAIQVSAVTISSGAGKIVLNGENRINDNTGSPKVDNPAGVYIAPNSNITSTTGSIYSTTKSSGTNNFGLAIDQASNTITTINSSSGGSIRLDATNTVSSQAALGLTNSGQRATIRFSSLPTVAGLFILINGSIQPVTYTAESNAACTVSITNCGYVTVLGSNGSYQNAIYGSSTAATKATYVTVAGETKVYDGLNTALNFTSSDFTKESLITWPTLFTNTYIAANYNFKTASKNVGSYSSLTDYNSSGTTPATYTDGTGTYAIGWTYTSPYTITAKTLTTTLASTVSKEYNATTTATLSNSNFSVPTGVSGETISVTKTTGTYDNKNVGTGKTVTANLASGDYSITGTNALLSNYTLTTGDVTGNVGTITQKALTMSGLSVPSSKVYDGTTTAVVTDNKVFTGSEEAGTGSTSDGKWYTGDTVNFTGTATGTYNFKDVSTATTVTYGGLSLTGAQAGNYSLTQQTPAAATITQKALTMSGLSVPSSKVYDGTTTAVVTDNKVFTGSETAGTGSTSDGKWYTGDTVNFTGTATGTYNFKDVSTATTVTYGGLSLTGAQAGNYSLTQQTPAAATITQKALTMSGLSVPSSKVYDGTTTAVVTDNKVFTGSETAGTGSTSDGKWYTGDTVNFTGTATGTYNFKDVSTATTVTYGGLSLTGAQAGNYSLTQQTPAAATITQKALTMSGLSVPSSKVYDGTTTAVVTDNKVFTGSETAGTGSTSDGKWYTGDTVNFTGTATGTYNFKDVSTATTVTYGGLSLTGAQAGNYSLTQQTPAAATITQKALTMSGLSVPSSKVYDGTTTAVVTDNKVFTGSETAGTGSTSDGKWYTGDTVNFTGTATGTYNFKDVSTATTVTYGGLSLTGAQAGNYSLTQQTPAAATITQKALTMSGLSVPSSKVYDGTTTAVVTDNKVFTGSETAGTGSTSDGKWYTGDTVNFTGTATGTYNFKDVSTATTVTYGGLSLTGAQAGNYSLTQQTPAAATITQKTVGLLASKTYDGNTSLTDRVTVTTDISGEALTYTGATTNDSHVATSSKYINEITLANGTGALATNYKLPTLNNANAPVTITAATLTPTISNTSVTKEYDGTTATSITPTYSFSGFVSGDTDATLTYDTKLYNSKNVNDANKVTVSGLGINSITGNKSSLASDYSLNSSSKDVAATITAKTLTVSGITAANKDFDETTAATVRTSGAVYSGKVTGDRVTVSATGTFASASVGTGKTVNLTSIYTGTDVTNYNITSQATTTANITNPGETPPEDKKTTTNSNKLKCELEDCNKNKLVSGEIVIVKKNIFNDDKATVTPISIKPNIEETPITKPRDSLVKIIILKPGAEPVIDKEYQVTIRGNDAILKENIDVADKADKTITSPGKSIGSARFSIENDKGKILEYNMVVRESGLEIRPLSFEALQFADKNKATVAGAAMIDVVNNLKLSVDNIKTIILDLIIDKVFEEAMFNSKETNKNIFNVNYY